MDKVDAPTLAKSPFAASARLNLVPVAYDALGEPRSSYEITFPTAILWGLVGCIMTFAIALVTERSHGTLLRLRMAPLSWSQILAGKWLACFVTALTVAGLLLLLGRIGLGVRWSNPVGLALAMGSLGVCFTGLMMLLATFGKSERAVAGAGWGVLMPFMMIGGGMIPLAFMPGWMQTVSNISPIKWGILALEGAIWRRLHSGGVIGAVGHLGRHRGSSVLARRDDTGAAGGVIEVRKLVSRREGWPSVRRAAKAAAVDLTDPQWQEPNCLGNDKGKPSPIGSTNSNHAFDYREIKSAAPVGVLASFA